MLLSARELLVRQRTQLVNALRGHAAELGVVAQPGGKGLAHCKLSLPPPMERRCRREAKQALALLGHEIDRIEARLAEIDAKLMTQHKANPVSRRLPHSRRRADQCPEFRVRVDAASSSRHGISPPGSAWCRASDPPPASSAWAASAEPANERLRSLLVLGATTVIQHAKPGRPAARPGCSTCWSAGRASSRRWLWPTRWPGSFGPC